MHSNIFLAVAPAALTMMALSPTGSQAREAMSALVPARSPGMISTTEEWELTSRITGHSYHIYISKPAASTPPPEGYPVIYLTDGDYMFHVAADTLTMQSAALQAKPAIIVGIGYGDGFVATTRNRYTDLTPTQADPTWAAEIKSSPTFASATFGGAEGFYRFITQELRPQIDATYATDKSDNTLWGHSLGGLFGLHVLFNHPEAFKTYLIGSPTIIWNHNAILKDESRLADAIAAGQATPRILLTAGGLEETVEPDAKIPPGTTREKMQARFTAAATVRNVNALAGRLKAMKSATPLEVATVVFEGETHVSVMPAMLSRGLRFALKP
jgi:predicted alpha/beta superfamily hydrolase